LSIYLDTSVIVALLTRDALAHRADTLLRRELPVLIVSDFAAAELASAIARLVRLGALTHSGGRAHLSAFDAWTARATQRLEIKPSDIAAAAAFLRRLDLTLRTPDAIHVAMAQRMHATLATFDAKLAAAGEQLGLPVLTA
jgi:predicted nucleic acid-binding protein